MKKIIPYFAIIILLLSCNKDPEVVPEEEPTPTPAAATVSFSSDVHPIFITNCNGSYCHGGGADGKNFDTHTDVVAIAEVKILGAINHTAGYEPMPKSSPKLRQGLIDTITTWINEGKLDN